MSLPSLEIPAAPPEADGGARQTGYDRIEVRRLTDHIGAVVDGVRIGGDLDDTVIAEVLAALHRNRVIFFRDQHHADDDAQRAFAARLGTVTSPHPTVAGDGEAVLPIDAEHGKANSWHTDVTFVDRIPSASLLRAVELPPFGGTTVWADTVHAYEQLHPALKALVDQLWALHSNQYDYVADHRKQGTGGVDVKEQAYRDEFTHLEFETEHPVVRIHPATGERSLLLGHFIRGFIGLPSRDSQDLFNLLQRHVTDLDNTVRWSWAPGDLAIWDNAATQHYAVDDYGDAPRRLHRLTLAGEVPVAIDGSRSRVRKGDAAHFSVIAA